MATPPHHPQCTSLDFDFTSSEHEVAQILLQLPLLFQKSEFSLGLIPAWSIRRKRSALDLPPDSSAVPPPPLSPSKNLKESSPNTPLFLNSSLPLSRSESDENANAKRSKKKPSLNKKSQYLEAIDELTKQNQVLEGDVETMKQHYNHLKTINSELKAKKQEMILGSKNESEIQEIGSSSSATKIVKFTVKSSSSTLENHQHQHQNQFQPSINNQTAPTAEQSNNIQNFQMPIGAIPLYDPSSLGPMGIPDLNISFEEINQRNYSRFMAARARQNRIQIYKNKNGITKLQSPPNPCI